MKRSRVRNAVLFLVTPFIFMSMASSESYAIPSLSFSLINGEIIVSQDITVTSFTSGCPTGFTCYGFATGNYLDGAITVASTGGGTTLPYIKIGDTGTLDTIAVTRLAITNTSTGTVDILISASNVFEGQLPGSYQEGISLSGSAQALSGQNLGGSSITMEGFTNNDSSDQEFSSKFGETTVNLPAVIATNFGPVPIKTAVLTCTGSCGTHALTEQLNVHIEGQDTIRFLNSPTVGSGIVLAGAMTSVELDNHFAADRAGEAVPEPESVLLLGLGGLGLLVYGLFRKRDEVTLA